MVMSEKFETIDFNLDNCERVQVLDLHGGPIFEIWYYKRLRQWILTKDRKLMIWHPDPNYLREFDARAVGKWRSV